jgi:hypothetical protein
MRVELHDNLTGSVSIPASRVVIYDDYDNPIAVAIHVDGGHYIASTVAQPAFKKLLKALGVNKTVIVQRLDTANLKPLL